MVRIPTEPRLTSRLAGDGLIAQFESAGVGAEKNGWVGYPLHPLTHLITVYSYLIIVRIQFYGYIAI